MSDDSPTLKQGDCLGAYRVLGPLGSGGMGEVYRAVDTRLDREVAVKVILGGLAADPAKAARFEREAKILAAMDHPNLLAIHDVGREGDLAYLVTELLEGETLRDKLAGGPLDVRSALRIALQIAFGLAAAHDRGIIHRDLKPSNVFVTRDMHVKILDFGLARLEAVDDRPASQVSEAPTAEGPTRPGVVLGTSGYMSPEQVRGRAVDVRSDIFALGILLYEMLSGRRPFSGSSNADMLAAILTANPPPLSKTNRPVPPALEEVIRRCLEKDPEMRFQSARDVLVALEVCASGDSSTISRVHAPGRPIAWRWVAAVAGAVAAVVALTVWMGLHAREGRLPAFEPRQVTYSPGLETSPAVAPDGNSVAYSAQDDLWVADRRGGAPLRLTTDGLSNDCPAWFPDGSALLYASKRGGRDGIWKISRFGGAPSLIVPDARSPAVSPDSTRVAFARLEAGQSTRIWVADLGAPLNARRLTGDADGVWDHAHPSWSPDGRTLCYNDQNDLWLVPAAGGRASKLTSDDAPDCNPAWSPDGRHVYFQSLREAGWAIWRIPAAGGAMGRVTLGSGLEQWPSISADARRLAYATGGRWTCSALDRATGERTVLWSGAFTGEPSLSPDGRWLSYTSAREGAINIWRVPLLDGKPVGDPERVTDQRGNCSNTAYSPDGRWIAYQLLLQGQRHIWVVPAEGGPPTAFTSGLSSDTSPEWSLDGKRISFISDRGGTDAIWAAPFRDGWRVGEPQDLIRRSGMAGNYCWSSDGRRIAFCADDSEGRDVWTAEAAGSGESVRLTAGAGAEWVTLDPATGDILVLGAWGGPKKEVRRVAFGGGPPRPVPGFGSQSKGRDLMEVEASRDGRFFVVIEQEKEGDVWMLEAKKGAF